MIAGAVAIALPHVVHDPFFDSRLTNWIGLMTHRPATEDYVPVLPWIGVMWWGMAAGQWLLVHHRDWLTGPLPSFTDATISVGDRDPADHTNQLRSAAQALN